MITKPTTYHKNIVIIAVTATVLSGVLWFLTQGFLFQGEKKVQSQAVLEAPAPASVALNPQRKYKILYVMSYHESWKWTQEQLEGFQYSLRDLDVEYRTFEMDTKRNSSTEWKEQIGAKARAVIDAWQPDLVYTSDDDAQEYVTKHYVNQDIPFVFSAVNAEPEKYGFVDSKNISGVLERPHFAQSVQLLKRIKPEIKKIAVVIDDSSMWDSVIQTMKKEASQLPEIEITSWDTIYTFDEYKEKVKGYQNTVDAIALIGIFGFKDENGFNVPYQDVLRWTSENSNLPDFTFWDDRISYGTLCTVTVSGYEQGLAAGEIVRGILVEGNSPASFPMKQTVKGEPYISLARANKLGLAIESEILLTARVVQEFEWEE